MKGQGRAAAEIGKSICVSAVFTLAAVLVFALFIKLFSIGSSVIMPVNQIIKMLAIFLGCFLCIRGSRPVLRGAASGVGVTIVTFFLFESLRGNCLSGGVICSISCSGRSPAASAARFPHWRGKSELFLSEKMLAIFSALYYNGKKAIKGDCHYE